MVAGIVFLVLSIVGRIGPYVDLDRSQQKRAALVAIVLLVFGIGLYVVPPRAMVNGPGPEPPPDRPEPGPTDTCAQVEIIGPHGTRDRSVALNYPVKKRFKISWRPAGCPMIIQYYQNDRLIKEFRPASLSDTEIDVSKSGETELKIWYESSVSPGLKDKRWVWVK